jgi:hypothetical protein
VKLACRRNIMKRGKTCGAILILLIWLPFVHICADGGYFSSRSVALSADQRAIIIKNGNEISMIFSTGYTGEGEDFAWIIPTPVPPAIEDVSEAGEMGETAFELLDQYTAPYRATKGGGWGGKAESVVTVYGTVTLEHYEVSIVGAAAATPLLDWLQRNGYKVDPEAGMVLDAYIRENWAFVAAKLNPGEKRHYENEFLPPLTVKYRSDLLIFPLRISSVSTAETARISLYVIAESTVSSSNLTTTTLLFRNTVGSEDPGRFVERGIRRATGRDGRGVVVLWKGEYPNSPEFREILEEFMVNPHLGGTKAFFLTRLDARMDPSAMTDDVELVFDPAPRLFGRVCLNCAFLKPGHGTPRQLSGLPGVKAIAAGQSGTQEPPMVVLEGDGAVWAWKLPRRYGRLEEPVQVRGLSGVVAIAAGSGHTLALKQDETVWAWGWNGDGQLGDGSTVDRTTPVQVRGLSGMAAITAEGRFSVALKKNGTVWAWGWNSYGQLGDGSTTNRYTPVQVRGLSGVAAIAASSGHTLAVKKDGTVWAWGDNSYGELGDGSTTYRPKPVQARGIAGITAIAVEYMYNIGLKDDGTVWTWGAEMLYDGTVTKLPAPLQVRGLSGVVAIAAGGDHTVALKDDGTVWAWGGNRWGELGDDSRADSLGPVQVRGLSGVVAIAAGEGYTVALKNDGTVWAWGRYW